MSKEMLINVSEGEECRIAVLEDDRLEELYMERASATSHVGNIYKGRVTNVESSIQAAFVDFGLGRNGFLHISDLLPSYFGGRNDDVQEAVGRKLARHERPPIQRCLHRGDEIIVQIIKEGIGAKGPTLTTYLSIPGRILVMMPGMVSKGVSRKIEDETERRRLRQILEGLKPPRDCGFIIRTAGIGKTKAEIERDLKYLTRLWDNIDKKMKKPAPIELYTEGDLVTRTVRDVYSSDLDRIIVDNKEVARQIKEFIKISAPRTKNRVELYENPIPLFHKYDIEREIEQMYSRHVPLPGGGSLVIDSTEAVVAIDVNSGKFRDHHDAETTAFKTDMEAADEIPRQLRLRDLGGVIICDFIDLRFERHRRQLEDRIHDNLRNDRAKTKVLRMSQFGIIEMTRQRMRPSLKRSIYFDCPHCRGSGLVKTPESMSLDVMRRLAIAADDSRVAKIGLSVCAEVAFFLLNRKRMALGRLEQDTGKRITVKVNPDLPLDDMQLELLDARDGQVLMESLGMVPAAAPGNTQRPRRGRDRRSGNHGNRDYRQHDHDESFDQELDREERAHGTQGEHPAEQLSQQAEDRAEMVMQGPVSEAAPPPMESIIQTDSAPSQSANGTSGEPRRGRRRRRGGRGRGRSGGDETPRTAQAQPETIEESEPVDLVSDFEPDQPTTDEDHQVAEPRIDESAPPRQHGRRRRRGGRRHGSSAGGENQSQPTNSNKGGANENQGPAKSPAQPAPAIQQAELVVVRTGSTDRHLIEDEPILAEPPRRPRTYRDLDAIPDDLD